MAPGYGGPVRGREAGAYGRILGIGAVTIAAAVPGFTLVAQSIALGPAQTPFAPRVSGPVRIWWRISSVIVAPPAGATPRVRIGWSAQDEAARGNLLNPATPTPPGTFDPDSALQPPQLVCDAWYGQVELQGTSFKLDAGFASDDTAGGTFVVQATITEGGTGAEQFATFTRMVNVGVGPAPFVTRIPGATATVNNGAARVKEVGWFNATRQNVALTVKDFGGTARQLIQTGNVAAPAPYGPVRWPLVPNAEVIEIADIAGAAITDAELVFYYY